MKSTSLRPDLSESFNALGRHPIGLLVLLILLFSLGGTACQSAPVTGRSQLILVPNDTELQLGLTAYKEVLDKATLSTDPTTNEMVQRVGRRIAQVANRPDYQWEFNLIQDDKTINAFALPGGKVAVYTGILLYTQDETGMATVLGHEVAHALARHGAERMSSGLLAEIGMAGLDIALQKSSPGVIQSVNAAYGLGVNVGVLLPFNRQQESEADHIGLILMARAGYNPEKAIDFWQRMAGTGKAAPPEFLSTHPTDKMRIEQIRAWLPEALKIYQSVPPAPGAK